MEAPPGFSSVTLHSPLLPVPQFPLRRGHIAQGQDISLYFCWWLKYTSLWKDRGSPRSSFRVEHFRLGVVAPVQVTQLQR